MTSAFSANLEEDRLPLLGLQIERQAALVAVQVLEIEPVAPRAGDIAPRLARLLDLDHIGPPIGELADRRRSGAGMTQIENGKSGQRQSSDAHNEVPLVLVEFVGELTPAARGKVKYPRRSRDGSGS